jgi:hypothetical protein
MRSRITQYGPLAATPSSKPSASDDTGRNALVDDVVGRQGNHPRRTRDRPLPDASRPATSTPGHFTSHRQLSEWSQPKSTRTALRSCQPGRWRCDQFAIARRARSRGPMQRGPQLHRRASSLTEASRPLALGAPAEPFGCENLPARGLDRGRSSSRPVPARASGRGCPAPTLAARRGRRRAP